MKPSNALLTIPNALSIARGLSGPIIMALIAHRTPWSLLTALFLMIAAEFSDFMDGVIARRLNQESQIGRLIDPICDSIYHLSVFLAFLYNGWMPAWMLFVIYSRDLAVPYIRAFAKQGGHDIWVRSSGKVKTAVHAAAQLGVVAIALGFLGDWSSFGSEVTRGLLLAATLASLYSLLDYGWAVARLLRR
jgi:CDP-diacylglycerol--glycerol-3-phosphate 3-phosphatidyltransferase